MTAKHAAQMDALYTYAEQTEHCTYCNAEPGEQCRNALGRWRRNPHKARMVSAESEMAERLTLLEDLARGVANARCSNPSCGYRMAMRRAVGVETL